MDAGEHNHKRVKTVEFDNIFADFLKNEKNVVALRSAYASLTNGYNKMKLCILHIEVTNARTCEDFSRASCHTTKHKGANPLENKTFQIGSIFGYGLAILKNYICEEVPKVPQNIVLRRGLAKLLKFLSNDCHDALRGAQSYDGKEGEWAIRIAQHLLSQLAVESSYTIDSYPEFQGENSGYCLCKDKDQLLGKQGDTSFGCRRGWHGRADILMDDLLPVNVTGEECDDDVSENISVSSSIEVKSSQGFSERDIKQILAQTIVLSFLQHKQNEKDLKNFLIPGIGISAEKVIVFFYDCVQDVLLGTAPLDLRGQPSLNHTVVVFLWLTLNYKYFCSGVTEDMKAFKADFFRRVENDFLEIYRNEVTRPMQTQRCDETTEDDYLWTVNSCPEMKVENYGIDFVSLQK